MPGPPLSASDLTGLVTAANQQIAVLNAILNRLNLGVAILASPPTFTVASLPTTGIGNGSFAFASNGRKGGEGAGLGTGVPVYWNAATSQWFTYSGNILVTA